MNVSATKETSQMSKVRRVFGVEPTHLGLEEKTSRHGVRNRLMFAMKCHEEKECLSFSYTKLEERCVNYDKLLLGGIATNVSDSSVLFSKIHLNAMAIHDGLAFCTFDRDVSVWAPGIGCAANYNGAWWYNDCFMANLNGKYMTADGTEQRSSMNWEHFPRDEIVYLPLKKSKMMIQ
ncbi:ficolin-2-like [Argopecten irradians]|uniref:ficolin-2-like n=1 Tax=Argopecten irradians TaxID=31199 RepID=UPI003717C641